MNVSPNLLELTKQHELLVLSPKALLVLLLAVPLAFTLGIVIFMFVGSVLEKMKQSTNTSQQTIQN